MSTPLFASQPWGTNVGNTTSIQLYPINISTGATSPVLSFGNGLTFAGVDDLASDPARQPSTLWAVRTGGVGNELIAVDPFKGQLLSNTLLNAPSPILSIAIDPTNGGFYGATVGELYRINPDTGATTLVGATAMSVDKALGFDGQGNLYGVANNNELIAINKSTAATSLVAMMNLERMEDIAVRPEDGVMYGLGFSPYSLYRIDLATGGVTEIGQSVGRPGGFAFTAVPEPSGTALGLLAVVASGLLPSRRAPSKRR